MGRNGQAALVAEDIHKSFGPVEVLKGVSVTAHVGDVIAMIGASGSGKSTFLRCINLLETPDSGTVTVSGETIAMVTDRQGKAKPADLEGPMEICSSRSTSANTQVSNATATIFVATSKCRSA